MRIHKGKPVVQEKDIINQIIDYLNLRKIPWVKFRNTGVIIKHGSETFFGRVKAGHEQRGAPDIVACYRGRIYLIEVKTVIGKMSDYQKDFHATWVEEGQGQVVSVIARSVDDVAGGLI